MLGPNGVRRRRHASKPEFWDNVDRSGGPDACWPWTGPKDRDGYGTFKGKAAHREAFRRSFHEPRFHVLHHCDNPPCQNPGHLFEGTATDNMRDCIAKGRHASQRPEFVARLVSLALAARRAKKEAS